MQFPEVELDFLFVDNADKQLIQYPKQFDVVLTSNMFGDILPDEASELSGSMGLLPSASVGQHTSLFEPIHDPSTRRQPVKISPILWRLSLPSRTSLWMCGNL